MSSPDSLRSLFQKKILRSSPYFDIIVSQSLQKGKLSDDFFIENLCSWKEPFSSEEKNIENWKNLLAENILCTICQSHQNIISEKVRLFGRQPWNQSSQFFRSIVALNHALVKMPIPEVGSHLLESGAALIDLHEYSPWLSLPYTPEHYEFGLFLSMLSLLTKRTDLKETALRLTRWQLNTLDSHAIPLKGLFVREGSCQTAESLSLSYLLFQSAYILSGEPLFKNISKIALNSLALHIEDTNETINPLWVLLEAYFLKHQNAEHNSLSSLQEKTLENQNLSSIKQIYSEKNSPSHLNIQNSAKQGALLPEQIHDPSTALVGYRTEAQHVFCTLHGGGTGLGSIKNHDVEIVSYGPQYLPLASSQGFGIEGNALSDHGMRRSIIEWKRQSFTLKGCTRMVDQPSTDSRIGIYRGIWLEVNQEFKLPHFYININFIGLDGWDSVGFSFFIKAKYCHIHSHKTLSSGTPEGYEGESRALTFSGLETEIELNPIGFEGTMQIIPLSGNNDFWGANFLVSYHLSSACSHYQWHIRPVA